MTVNYFEINDYLDIPTQLIEDWCSGHDFVVLQHGIVATIGGCIVLYGDKCMIYYPPDLWKAKKVREEMECQYEK